MYVKIVTILGGVILLFSMSFAVLNIETADTWIALWLPFVIAGVVLCFVGSVALVSRE